MMKNTLLTIVFALCFLAPVAGQITAIKPTTPEQSGDENAAAGKHAEAIAQYKTAWLGWFIGRNEADADLRSAHERLAGKMGATLAKMTTRPTIPEDADFHAQKGAAFVKLAKTPLDFLKAAGQFQEAVNAAPWVFDYHFNLAVAHKSAGQFKDALYSLSLAKLLAANEKDRRDANGLRAEIEAANEIASDPARATDAQRTSERNRFSGKWKSSAILVDLSSDGSNCSVLSSQTAVPAVPFSADWCKIVNQNLQIGFSGKDGYSIVCEFTPQADGSLSSRRASGGWDNGHQKVIEWGCDKLGRQ